MARVLVIDDDQPLRDLFRELLARGGHRAEAFATAKEGLARLEAEQVDLVVTDVIMPETDGLETIREIRRTHPGVRVVAVSGGGAYEGLDYLHLAKLMGANATLSKPVRMQKLLSTVAEVLELDPPG